MHNYDFTCFCFASLKKWIIDALFKTNQKVLFFIDMNNIKFEENSSSYSKSYFKDGYKKIDSLAK